MEWDERYLIGNERIDFEHRIFFNLIQSFGKARETGAAPERLARIFDEVVLYAKFHFKSEENHMQDIGYPALDEHKRSHYGLTSDISNKLVGLKMGTLNAEGVEKFLVDWFINHVAHEDSLIAKFEAEKK